MNFRLAFTVLAVLALIDGFGLLIWAVNYRYGEGWAWVIATQPVVCYLCAVLFSGNKPEQ